MNAQERMRRRLHRELLEAGRLIRSTCIPEGWSREDLLECIRWEDGQHQSPAFGPIGPAQGALHTIFKRA
jgi:hypothetical protein